MDRFRIVVRRLLKLALLPSPRSVGQELCRAFLETLSTEPGTPERERASQTLHEEGGDPKWRRLAVFLAKGADIIEHEIEYALANDAEFRDRIEELWSSLRGLGPQEPLPQELLDSFWAVFLPEASGVVAGWEGRIQDLREKRTVQVETLSPDPVRHPAREILWTSNVLLTIPPKHARPESLHMKEEVRRRLEAADLNEQKYWYDHPVPIGVAPENNEVLYGLRGLSEMLAFEKKRRTAVPSDRLDVVLSLSVTHPGLHRVARPYIESLLKPAADVHGLNIHLFTEEDTVRLIEGFLTPAARRFGLEAGTPELFAEIFGVDGPYGRHYNFLKAISAVWQLVRETDVKATFKIDLDQVFPQARLVEELGRSAFELLTTPLWGAMGRDSQGMPVELGMIAGALVNQADIDRGLFTPDVKLPKPPFSADRWVFATQVPQALSTVAEMMTRYHGDGERRCLSRIHVTGGTTGIRVDALRRYRPFTLSPISRAEDQAYILSVLHEPGPRLLRYVHVPGLIMRHDKASFAVEAIEGAAAGKSVGDFERMILFSGYARGLPWPWRQTRSSLEPFTGSFVHRTPFTTALLAFALKALGDTSGMDVEQFLEVGSRKLGSLLDTLERTPDWLGRAFRSERAAWNAFHDVLDQIENGLRAGSQEARKLAAKANTIVDATRLDTD